METEKDIQLLLLNWYDGVVSMSSRITTGNLSHKISSLKGYLSRISVFAAKHYPDDELAIKHSKTFASLAEKCDRITTGNLSHEIALIRGIAINYVSLFKDLTTNN